MNPVNPCKMNAMWVFHLERPEEPRLVGTVSLAPRPTKCTFAYDPSWANDGFDLSPDLPRNGRPTVPTPLDWAAPGAIEDAMPDRWGHNTIRVLDRPARLTPLDFLYHAGDRRFGALGVSTSPERYEPYADVPLLTAASLDDANEIIQRVIAKQPLTERERMLLRSSKTMGGAHPKMLIDIDGEEWLAKFPKGDYVDVPLIEHASSVLARMVGIRTPETRAHRISIGHVFLSRRFDRRDGRRIHALTARTMMLPERQESYAAMASVLRRLGTAADGKAAQRELFVRMALNILIDNTDDHSKNHAFLRMPLGHWDLAPAYDVLPQTTGLEQQAIPIALGASGSLASAVAAAAQFQMAKEEAVEAWRTVATCVSRWKEIFDAEGVTGGDIDYVSTFIDSDYLLGMRGEEALASAWTR